MKKYIAEAILIATSLLIVWFSWYRVSENTEKTDFTEEIEAEPIVQLAWGFEVNTIHIDSFKVKSGQNLSDILSNYSISAYQIDQLARKSKDIFDVRKIKSGNAYYLINKDTVNPPEYFIYEESAVDYVIFDLDSINVFRGQKQIDTITQTTAGVIQSSLWNSFIENQSRPTLALELSDIFAWTIDFFGIQSGDEYKVIYDELFVDNKFVGIGKVHAATIVHMGDTISAYYYNNNKQEGFFDKDGASLRKAFLKAPLQFSRISSRFSNGRMHPVLKIRRPHHGVDYAAPIGTPVHSIGDGTIVKKAYQKGGGGNYLTIKHNSVYTSQYMHLNGYAKGIATGVRVKQGQLIGYVGKTGLASGPHLDFRIQKNGKAIDPLKVKAPPVEPISEENKTTFQHLRDSVQTTLFNIHPKVNSELLTTEQ